VTPRDFAEALLHRLDLPVTDSNVAALVAFQAHEGGHMANAAAYNPINTTLKMPGSRPVTKIGVQAYASWDDGIEATARTLAQPNMRAITSSLARSASADDTLRAVAKSPWGCTICASAPARTLQGYAEKVFPIGKGMLDTGEGALRDLFAFRSTASKVGAVVVGGAILTGVVLLLVKSRRSIPAPIYNRYEEA